MKKLFILGNGFDIACGYHTSYLRLFDYVRKHKDDDCVRTVYELYNSRLTEEQKSCFEDNVCNVDSKAFSLLANFVGPERLWFDVLQTIKLWIKDRETTKRYEENADIKNASFSNSFIITFNYTCNAVMEFNASPETVVDVHGAVWEDYFFEKSQFIFGHGDIYQKNQVLIGDHLYERFCSLSKKDIHKAIANLSKAINCINNQWFNFESICIFGFSFSEVDYPVLEKIVNCFPNREEIKVFVCLRGKARSNLEKYYRDLLPNYIDAGKEMFE